MTTNLPAVCYFPMPNMTKEIQKRILMEVDNGTNRLRDLASRTGFAIRDITFASLDPEIFDYHPGGLLTRKGVPLSKLPNRQEEYILSIVQSSCVSNIDQIADLTGLTKKDTRKIVGGLIIAGLLQYDFGDIKLKGKNQ